MGYAQRLVGLILAQERARGNSLVDEKVYRDEPILRTGADLLADAAHRDAAARRDRDGAGARMHAERTADQRASVRRSADKRVAPYAWEQVCPAVPTSPATKPVVELPPTLKELRALEQEADAFILAENQLFVDQALLAASYEDDYAFTGSFQHYFPTYRAMDDDQLRGYFAWRTKLRRGKLERTELSFAFVHLYELINGIGATGIVDPRQGFDDLTRFCRDYGELDPRIERHARAWCRDYALYHDLREEAERLAYETGGMFDRDRDEALALLQAFEAQDGGAEEEGGAEAAGTNGPQSRPAIRAKASGPEDEAADGTTAKAAGGSATDERLFDALAALSSYRVDQSHLLKEDPDALRAVTCGTWRALSRYYRAKRKRTLFEHLFGVVSAIPHALFRSAIFRPREKHPDTVVEIGTITRFICENGRWRCERLHQISARSRQLGSLLKAVDGRLRERLGTGGRLKDASAPKYVCRIIDRQIDELLAARKQREAEEERARQEAERRRIKIDFSKLSGIRAEAALSCEALLVDEERETKMGIGTVAQDAATVESDAAGGRGAVGGRRETVDRHDGASSIPITAQDTAKAASKAPPISTTPAPAESGSVAASVAPSPFSSVETTYLRFLLAGAPASERHAALQGAGISEAMMIDAVNEKALDEIGDIIIEEGPDGPELLEDYVEDVRGFVQA